MRVPETSEAWMRFPLRKNCLRPETTSQRRSTTRPSPSKRAEARAAWAPSRTSWAGVGCLKE